MLKSKGDGVMYRKESRKGEEVADVRGADASWRAMVGTRTVVCRKEPEVERW